jgi:hypothetical protein
MNENDISADDINWTMRRVFGDGNLYPHTVDADDDGVHVHQLRQLRREARALRESYLREPRLACEVRRVQARQPEPRVLPRFREVMEDPGPPPAIAHPAVAAARTWLHAARHAPTEATKDALLADATRVVSGLLGDADA